jgi:TatD DNase family protein
VKYFDTHCHLNHAAFREDLEEVLTRASASGVEHILVPGWDLQSSREALQLAEKYPQIVAAVGVHPSDCDKVGPSTFEEMQKLADHPKVAAIGEIGLDYHYGLENIERQKEVLQEMFSIAAETGKRVILHSRDSFQDIKKIVLGWLVASQNGDNPLPSCPAIFHAFEGNLEDAKGLMEYGCVFGVGGPLTYKNSNKLNIFSALPEEKILLETDAPYLPPSKHRGERNEPSYLTLIGRKLAEIREQDEQDLCTRIFENSYKMMFEE